MARPDVNAAILETAAERLAELDTATLRTVDERLRDWSRTTTTGGAGTGPKSKGTHSDPTAQAAGKRDRFTADLRRVNRLCDEIAGKVAELTRLVSDVMAPPLPKEPGDRGIPSCGNPHGCPDGNYADPGRRGRCETCYRYQARNDGRDRMPATASARRDGTNAEPQETRP